MIPPAIRSQRLSDTYAVRQQLLGSTGFLSRLWERAASSLVRRLVDYVFPLVIRGTAQPAFLFQPSTAVRLLCDHRCADGHICCQVSGHGGSHVCAFGHVNSAPIPKCPHMCDCARCEADCALPPGHGGPHQCHFRHPFSEVPGSAHELASFQLEKGIGDYVDELAHASEEEIRFAHVPEAADFQRDETWPNTSDMTIVRPLRVSVAVETPR